MLFLRKLKMSKTRLRLRFPQTRMKRLKMNCTKKSGDNVVDWINSNEEHIIVNNEPNNDGNMDVNVNKDTIRNGKQVSDGD